jgi:hypothetical protein
MDVLYHILREDEYHFVQCSNADDAILRLRALERCRFNRQALKTASLPLRSSGGPIAIRSSLQPIFFSESNARKGKADCPSIRLYFLGYIPRAFQVFTEAYPALAK